MSKLLIIKHTKGAPGLRFLGLGPYLIPTNSLEKLKLLLDKEAFWAKNRTKVNLKKMLANSSEIISIWNNFQLIGFGRATSDKVFRAVLWDVVVAKEFHRKGLGSLVINNLIKAKSIKNVEKIYLMTTKGLKFYKQQNFEEVLPQKLLLYKK